VLIRHTPTESVGDSILRLARLFVASLQTHRRPVVRKKLIVRRRSTAQNILSMRVEIVLAARIENSVTLLGDYARFMFCD
jgi:hypothetical protein